MNSPSQPDEELFSLLMGMHDLPDTTSLDPSPDHTSPPPATPPTQPPGDSDLLEAAFDALFEKEFTVPEIVSELPSPGRLTSYQERLWFIQKLQPDNYAYVIPNHLLITGPLDVDLLCKVLCMIWRRHESLRAVYPTATDGPRVRLLALDAFLPEVLDFRENPDPDAWKNHYTSSTNRAFRLDDEPLLRARIYRLAPGKNALLMDLHHINGDGATVELINRDIRTLYEAGREERPFPDTPPAASYVEFADYEHKLRNTPDFARQIEECSASLKDAPTELNLPFDKPLPRLFSHHGDCESWQGSSSDFRLACEKGRGLGLTPFMTTLCALGLMLHKYTGQEQLLVGIPVSLRNNERFAHTMGFFVNTGIVKLDFRGNPDIAEIMSRTRKAVRDMVARSDVPMDELVRRLCVQRNNSRPQLVQAVLSFLEKKPFPEGYAELQFEFIMLERKTAMFELTVDMFANGDELFTFIEYSDHGFEAATVRRMHHSFIGMFKTLSGESTRKLSDLVLFRESDRREASQVLDGAPMETTSNTVPSLLLEAFARNPERTVIIHEGNTISASTLAGLIAHRRGQLRGLNIGQNTVLALRCEDGLEWIAACIAAHCEGATVLPLDPGVPEKYLRHCLENSGATLLWHDGRFEHSTLPCPSAGINDCAEASPVFEACAARPADRAYIIQTSGSTGKPKGVEVAHQAFETHCRAAALAYDIRKDDRALAFAPPCFDAFWEQLFAPLVAGACVLVKNTALWTPEDLCRRLSTHDLTLIDLPPLYLREFLLYLETHPEALPSTLRTVITGGEALPSKLAADWLKGPLANIPLINAYGPTEALVTCTFNRITQDSRIHTSNGSVPIGRAMPGRFLHILDENGKQVAPGAPGELCIGGSCLAMGYNDPEKTAAAFRHWTPAEGGRWAHPDENLAIRLYRSGDRVRLGPAGELDFLGRIDTQIKLRGYRIEPGEIENVITAHPAIAQAIVTTRDDPAIGKLLIAYCRSTNGALPDKTELNQWMTRRLPPHMVPATTVFLPSFPTRAGGKIDFSALPAPVISPATHHSPPPKREDNLEERIASIWRDLLGGRDPGPDDNFFDLGGHSLLLIRMLTRIKDEIGTGIEMVDLFANPTVSSIVRHLRGEKQRDNRKSSGSRSRTQDIAVIGMAGRFPGAWNVDELWNNLENGVESIRFFTDDELGEAGIPPQLRSDPAYVPAHGHMEGTRLFDAAFFGYTPREAALLDPQQRIFLEESWHALEHAGCDPSRYPGEIGVFGGVGMNLYMLRNLAPIIAGGQGAEAYATSLFNDKDFITTRVSYKLDLRGPSVNVNTACSTSLVAIHMAARSLISGECDLALAGGVTLSVPEKGGYLFQPGGIASPDGHCRAFAEEAEGTVGGSGVAIVALKRLDDAIADHDSIHAVIKGSAINNDGADKVGFTAPGVNRQRDVIRASLNNAGISAADIQYIEAHGTGTPMGDPIEIRALCDAFAPDKVNTKSCYIGSIKSNIGHLDTAAGVAGFIKTALALQKGLIPPTLHCENPSTHIDFGKTPFQVANRLIPWPEGVRRRAGVSSFGMGGTNAHITLEAPPNPPGRLPAKTSRWLLPLSAKTPRSLLRYADALAHFIESSPDLNPGDVLFTLCEGRRRFDCRVFVDAKDPSEAVAMLRRLGESDLVRVDKNGSLISSPGKAAEDDDPLPAAWLLGSLKEVAASRPQGDFRKIPLPLYCFDHEEHWIEARPDASTRFMDRDEGTVRLPLEKWLHYPTWERIRSTPGDLSEPLLIIHSGSTAERIWIDAMRDASIPFHAFQAGEGLEASLSWLARKEGLPQRCALMHSLASCTSDSNAIAQRLLCLLGDLRVLARTSRSKPLQVFLVSHHDSAPDTPQNPVNACIAGAAACIRHEYPSLLSSAVSLDAHNLSRANISALHSLPVIAPDTRRIHIHKGRFWKEGRATVRNTATDPLPLKENGVYLITGGLGGIGLTLARFLAENFRARLVLISRKAPGQASGKAIREMEAAGATIRTAAIDVADTSSLTNLVTDVSEQWGRIDGVIHTAGVPGGSLIARTSFEDIRQVLHPKVDGAIAIAQAFEGHDPDFVLLCSSLTATLGGPGQAGYASANAFLDAFALAMDAESPGHWRSLQWDTWAEVGMAVRKLSPLRPPVPEGTGLREWTFSPETCWPWGEHRIGGSPTLPGTAYFELFAAAGGRQFEGLTLLEPLVHEGEQSRLIRLIRHDDNNQFSLVSFPESGPVEHARATITSEVTPVPPIDLEAIRSRCTSINNSIGRDTVPENGIVIEAGPHWQFATSFFKGDNEALAHISLTADSEANVNEHPYHPALLDLAISFYTGFLPKAAGMLPWRYGRVSLHAPLGSRVYSHVRLTSQNDRATVFDATLCDESGRVLVEVEAYTLMKARDLNTEAKPALNPFAMTPDEGTKLFLQALRSAEPVLLASTVDWDTAVLGISAAALSASAPDTRPDSSTRTPRPDTGVPYRPPQTPNEILMTLVWGDVLGYDGLGLDDDLFDLGADSLTALQASARLKETAGEELSMEHFFQEASIANLAAAMNSRQSAMADKIPASGWEEGEL